MGPLSMLGGGGYSASSSATSRIGDAGDVGNTFGDFITGSGSKKTGIDTTTLALIGGVVALLIILK